MTKTTGKVFGRSDRCPDTSSSSTNTARAAALLTYKNYFNTLAQTYGQDNILAWATSAELTQLETYKDAWEALCGDGDEPVKKRGKQWLGIAGMIFQKRDEKAKAESKQNEKILDRFREMTSVTVEND